MLSFGTNLDGIIDYCQALFPNPNVLEWSSLLGGQQEERLGEVHHVQGEHHQSYLLHHYQNASILDRQIQCMKFQLQVSHVKKGMVEQSHTTP